MNIKNICKKYNASNFNLGTTSYCGIITRLYSKENDQS